MELARRHFEAQLKNNPDHMRSRAAIGFILLEQGDPAGAQQELERAVALDAENVDALFDLARASALNHQPTRAMEYFERVLQLSPDNTAAHYHLYLLYNRNGKQEKAKTELDLFHRLEEMDKMVRRDESALTKARKAKADSSGSGDSLHVPATNVNSTHHP